MTIQDRRGTVRRRGKTWTAQLEVGSEVTYDPETAKRKIKRHYWTKGGFERQRDAQRQLDTWRRELAEGAAPAKDGSMRHVADLAARWLTGQEGVLRPTTHRSYADTWRLHLAPFLGGLRISDVDASTIEALTTQLRTKVGTSGRGKGRPLAPSTVPYCLRVASTMFAWGVEVGAVSANPVEAANRRKRKGTAAARRARETHDPGRMARELSWGRAEVATFLAAADGHSHLSLCGASASLPRPARRVVRASMDGRRSR